MSESSSSWVPRFTNANAPHGTYRPGVHITKSSWYVILTVTVTPSPTAKRKTKLQHCQATWFRSNHILTSVSPPWHAGGRKPPGETHKLTIFHDAPPLSKTLFKMFPLEPRHGRSEVDRETSLPFEELSLIYLKSKCK